MRKSIFNWILIILSITFIFFVYLNIDTKNKKISKKVSDAFDYLDSLLKNKKFMNKIKLNRGELILLNNHILAHGRTTFKLEKKINKRKLYRIWIN